MENRRLLAPLSPDLLLIPFDTWPTGMLLVAGLDAANRQLPQNYDAITQEYVVEADGHVPPEVLAHRGAWAADDPRLDVLLSAIRQAHAAAAPAATMRRLIEQVRSNHAR